MKMTNKKLYFVEYWKNDGGWYLVGYDMSPAYTFYARDDKEARQLALGYIKENKVEGEDFCILKLGELKITRRRIKITNKESDLSKLVGSFKEAFRKARFTPLEERVIGKK